MYFQWNISSVPSLRSQTEKSYVQTVLDKTYLCPERPRRNEPMSRLSCVQTDLCVLGEFKFLYVQTFERSKSYTTRLYSVPNKFSCAENLNICASMSRLSCVQKHLCPDLCAFKSAYVQTFVPLCSDNVSIMYSFQA